MHETQEPKSTVEWQTGGHKPVALFVSSHLLILRMRRPRPQEGRRLRQGLPAGGTRAQLLLRALPLTSSHPNILTVVRDSASRDRVCLFNVPNGTCSLK